MAGWHRRVRVPAGKIHKKKQGIRHLSSPLLHAFRSNGSVALLSYYRQWQGNRAVANTSTVVNSNHKDLTE